MSDARVLIDFTEEVLAINKLQSTPPQGLELDAESLELPLLVVRHQTDQLCLVETSVDPEALPEAVASTRSRDDEIHLREIGDFTVVDVCHELVCQKVSNRGIASEQFERGLHILQLRQLTSKVISHHS